MDFFLKEDDIWKENANAGQAGGQADREDRKGGQHIL
jgi:hypothetical protein